MKATIKDIVNELTDKGYRTNEANLRYYHSLGLLPESEKVGIYQGGVSLIFPDKDRAINTVLRIFEFKGRGYKLSEIGEILKAEREKQEEEACKSELKQYKEVNGKYFLYYDKQPDVYQPIKRLRDILSVKELMDECRHACEDSAYRISFRAEDLDEVERRGHYIIALLFGLT